jgi:hypothetical protein
MAMDDMEMTDETTAPNRQAKTIFISYHSDDHVDWSDEEFCIRVARRCEELGRSQRQVLKEARVAHDYLQTTPTHGRRVDLMARVAKTLDWSLAEIMGLELNQQADVPILLLAYRTARDATRSVQRLTDEIFVEVLAAIYNLLLDRRSASQPVDDPVYLKMIADAFAKREAASLRPTPPKSPPG